MDMVEKVFTNANIVARMKFQFGTIDDKPILLIVLHIDGAQQTSFGHVLCVLARLMNLGHIARNPSALQIIALDEVKESATYFHSLFRNILLLQLGF